jgi:hypothetical protein
MFSALGLSQSIRTFEQLCIYLSLETATAQAFVLTPQRYVVYGRAQWRVGCRRPDAGGAQCLPAIAGSPIRWRMRDALEAQNVS